MSHLVKEAQRHTLDSLLPDSPDNLTQSHYESLEEILDYSDITKESRADPLERYGIRSMFLEDSGSQPIYSMELPFCFAGPHDFYNIIDLATRRGYVFVKTDLKLPDGIYKTTRRTSPPTYLRESSVSNMSSNTAADLFTNLNPSIDNREVCLSPTGKKSGRHFKLTSFSRLDSTNISGTVECDEDLNFLNYMLTESILSVYLRRNWDVSFTDFNNRMREITSWSGKRI